MATAIKIENLIKDFSIGIRGLKLRAVDNVSFEVAENKIFGLLGPNGCGKSTTMKILVGLLKPTRGSCEIFGQPSHLIDTRLKIGYMPEAPYFYKYLTGEELVRFYAKVSSVSSDEREERIKQVINMVDMNHAAKRRVGTYSKGMLQRIGLAQALVHNPDLLILDEPTAGVDPIGTIEIADIIRGLKESGKTILLCSHLLAEVEDICDEVAILNKGKLQALGPVSTLLENEKEHTIVVEDLSAEKKELLLAFLKEKNIDLNSISKSRQTLGDFFLSQTKD